MRRVRVGTWILLLIVVALGYGLVVHQRREAQLQAALTLYRSRASRSFVRQLNRGVILALWDGISLGELIEEVKARTQGPGLPHGVPIFIDASALREAGKTLISPVKQPPGQPLPLQQHLRLILEPVGLAYQVKDGAILITSRKAVDAAPASGDQTGEDEEDLE